MFGGPRDPICGIQGRGTYMRVHVRVRIAHSTLPVALPPLLPGPLFPDVLEVASICSLRATPALPSRESRLPAALRVCFSEQNVNSSPDGLLDLFN